MGEQQSGVVGKKRQDIVVDQDLKNGLSSVLEFAAEGFRLSGQEDARQYLLQVSRDIASGVGHPAPNPGPVTPLRLGAQPAPTGLSEYVKHLIAAALSFAGALLPGVGEAISDAGGPDAEIAAIGVIYALVYGILNNIRR